MKRREFLVLIGGTMTPARALRAQQKAMPSVGFLSGASPVPTASYVAAFLQGLGETGYVEGQNVAIQYRWAEGRYDRLPTLAADLVDRKVDVIAAVGGGLPGARAAKSATSTIPVIFLVGVDPVATGLVANLARPGGNLTGFTVLATELVEKRFELLSELIPQVRMIGELVNPSNPASLNEDLPAAARAARTKGMQISPVKAATEQEIDAAFATLVELRAGGLLIAADAFFFQRRDQLVALAARHALPTIYTYREFIASGGLISYGPSLAALDRQAGAYVGRILAGANPADLPAQQPTIFELVVNLKSAKALGLTVPPSILARADEVIE